MKSRLWQTPTLTELRLAAANAAMSRPVQDRMLSRHQVTLLPFPTRLF